MRNRNSRTNLSIFGAMSSKGADRAGNKLANAALLLASGVVVALLIGVIRWW
jgi:hypothetical protein